MHASDSGYERYTNDWLGNDSEMLPFQPQAFRMLSSWRPVEDACAALICHGALSRFPQLKVAVIENGSSWVAPLLKSMADLYKIEDPLSYKDKLTQPKFVVNAAGDQFFLPDSSQFYYDQLKGEKLLRYVANGDHSLKETDAMQSITAFYHLILTGKPLPKYSWTFEQDGSIKVKYQTPPSKVVMWQATNAKARDFRVDMIGRTYTSTELKQGVAATYDWYQKSLL